MAKRSKSTKKKRPPARKLKPTKSENLSSQISEDRPATVESTPSRVDTLLNLLIIVGVIIAGTLAILIAFPDLTDKLPFTDTSQSVKTAPTQNVGGIEITSHLNQIHAERLVGFMKNSIQEQFLPEALTLVKEPQPENSEGALYTGSWNKDGSHITVLIGLSTDESAAEYLRAWILPTDESVTQETAEEYTASVFQSSYVDESLALECRSFDIAGTEGEKGNECFQMKTDDDGHLRGFTTRSPILLDPPPGTELPDNAQIQRATAVSACLVPQEVTDTYPATACL